MTKAEEMIAQYKYEQTHQTAPTKINVFYKFSPGLVTFSLLGAFGLGIIIGKILERNICIK